MIGRKAFIFPKRRKSAEPKRRAPAGKNAFRLLPQAGYEGFRTGLREDLLFLGAGAAGGCLFGLLFYKRPEGLLLALPFACGLLLLGRRRSARKKKERMRRQLRDYLVSVISFLRAGYALENAMTGAEKELMTMHGEDSLMGREAAWMSRQIRLQIPPEQLLREFGDRTGLEEGEQLARVFGVAKRQGGDYLPVLKAMVRMMDESFSLRAEISVLLAGQRLEYCLMCLIPAGMLVYLDLSSGDLTAPLYEGSGPLYMTVFLAVYALGVLWGNRILEKSYEA